jgi:hypothetical protein
MTVSIPKPYWRVVNGVRESAAGAISRLTNSVAGNKAGTETTKTSEWSTVMAQTTVEAPAAGPTVQTVSEPSVVAGAPRAATAAASAAVTREAAATPVPARRQRRELNSAWVLTGMVLVVCVVATGWLFAHGTAAAAWLVALVVVAFAGVPLALTALRLLGYEDED